MFSGLGYNKSWIVVGMPIVRRGTFISRHIKKNNRTLTIGHGFCCYNNNKAELGATTPCIFNLLSTDCSIEIGNNVGITSTILNCRESITIGENVKIGSGCLIVDNDSHPIDAVQRRIAKGAEGICIKPVIIKNDVFIGARSIILKGVTIGEGSVIGAGSVVSHNIPPFTVACGNPAIVIKSLKKNE